MRAAAILLPHHLILISVLTVLIVYAARFQIMPKQTLLHPWNLGKTSKFLGVIAVNNGVRPKF